MKRIYLRAFEPEDYLLINQWRNDPDINNLLGGNLNFVSLEREKHWVYDKSTNDKNSVYLAICLVINDEMIGYISLINMDLRNLKVDIGGIIIGNKKLWRQGYSKEAYLALMRFVFNEYPINKIKNYCLEDHSTTIKTMNSLGFKKEGVLSDEIYKNGKFNNVIVFAILKAEYSEIIKDPNL